MVFINQLNKSCKSESNTIIPTKMIVSTQVDSHRVSTLPHKYIHYTRPIVYNNEIYCFGGADDTTYNTCYKFDGSVWTRLTDIPVKYSNSTVVVYNNEFHLIGSFSSPGGNTHYKFDGSAWTMVSTLPFSFYNNGVVVYNNEIHIFGSGSNSGSSNHYKWDGSNWTKVDNIPKEVTSSKAIVYNDVIHFFGTGNGDWDMHYIWDGNTWNRLTSTPIKFSDSDTIVYNDTLHLIGCRSSTDNKCHYIMNDDSSWTRIEDIPYNATDARLVVYDGAIHLLGVYDSSNRLNHYALDGISKETCVHISSKNSKVYADSYSKYGDEFNIPIDSLDSDTPPLFVYDKNESKLLYTNQEIKHNTDSGKYEIYGYFPSTLKGTAIPITSNGWQTLELDTPNLFN